MSNKKYDAIIIGAGQAGPSLAVDLANKGMKTALIERKLFGGTCVNTGCIPSKALIANAHVIHLVKNSEAFGVQINGDITLDMKTIKGRKDAIVERSTKGLRNWLDNTENCDVYEGHATFEKPHLINVHGERLEADKIFINVGARAFIPPISNLNDIDYFTNASIMNVDFVPEHLMIVGGSYIGLEFAQMYRRFGSKVTVIEKATRLLPKEDEDISSCIQDLLEQEAIEIHLGSECINFEKKENQIVAKLDCHDQPREVQGSHLLLAVGRVPNTHDLGLEEIGIKTDERGYILVNDQLGTNLPHVWALGECNGRGAFTHTAYNDYEIAIANLSQSGSRSIKQRLPAYCLYLDPPLGRIGMTEKEARESGRSVLIGKRPMSQVKRAVIKGEPEGLMKVLVDAKSHEILDAAILGSSGDEVIHSILDVMYAKAPYTVITNAVHIHPTVAELVPTMLGALKPLN